MKSSVIPKVLVVIVLIAGCSSSVSNVATSTTTTDIVELSSLLSRVDDSVSIYIERSLLQRPKILGQKSQEDLLACAIATSRDIARAIYVNRTGPNSATISGADSNAMTEMVINEATAAVQSQLEPILARCAQGS
jgi:hypothetical protein